MHRRDLPLKSFIFILVAASVYSATIFTDTIQAKGDTVKIKNSLNVKDSVMIGETRPVERPDSLLGRSGKTVVATGYPDSVEKSHHSVYSDTADTAFVSGVADSAKNVSDTVAAHINGTLRHLAAFTDATHLGNSTMYFTSPSMGVLVYSSGSIQAMSIGLTATCASDSLYANKSCFYLSPKLRHPDTVSSFDMVSVVDDSVVKVVSSSTFRTQIGAQAAISVTDNYVVKGNGTGALQPGIIYDDGTKVGIGTTTPTAKLQIAGIPSTAFGIIAGNDITNGGMTNNTRKYLRIGCPSYDIDEEPVSIIAVDNNGTDNILYLGGGTAAGNAPTEIRLKTDVLNTTIGTDRVVIKSDGNVGIGTETPLGVLDISSGGTTVVLGADQVATTRTNSIKKIFVVDMPHYLTAQPNIQIMRGESYSGYNELWIGNQSSEKNGPQLITFWLADDDITPATSNNTLVLSYGGAAINGFLNLYGLLDVRNDLIRLRTPKTPANSTATGLTGQICWDTNYIYVCYSDNQWGRIALEKTGW